MKKINLRFIIQAIKDISSFYYFNVRLAAKGRPSVMIRSDAETIRLIKEEGYSLARYGDGEFRWMRNIAGYCSFQSNSDALQEALLDSFRFSKKRLLIGIPRQLVEDGNCLFYARKHWRKFIVEYKDFFDEVLSSEYCYSNTNITRPYMDYQNLEAASKAFNEIKTIWSGRNVLICEGESTKFGIGNDLLDNAASVKRIICPSENAFSKYGEIANEIIKNSDQSTLVLLCLGPTATVLASDEEYSNIQMVDIGHLDIEYEWYLMKAKTKVPIPGKYVNEARSHGDHSLDSDPSYRDSIVAVIS